MQEIVAETQAKRNNRENESHFRKQPADQNSPPVDSCASHFSPVPLVELLAIITIRDQRKSVDKSPHIVWQLFSGHGHHKLMGYDDLRAPALGGLLVVPEVRFVADPPRVISPLPPVIPRSKCSSFDAWGRAVIR